jgi:anti-anti-sigma factor
MYEQGNSGMLNSAAAATSDESCALAIDRERGLITFRIAGIIDARAQELIDDIPHHIGSSPSGVRFDFAGVKRINSMGIALLLRCFKQIRDNKHTEIRLFNLNEVTKMLFKITGVFLLAALEEESNKEYVQ